MRKQLLVGALLLGSACTSAEERARKTEEAMVTQAKIEAAAESAFVQDSLKLQASITMDTVDVLVRTSQLFTNDDGGTDTDYKYVVQTRLRASCEVDSVRYTRMVKGDTLSCQWETPK